MKVLDGVHECGKPGIEIATVSMRFTSMRSGNPCNVSLGRARADGECPGSLMSRLNFLMGAVCGR